MSIVKVKSRIDEYRLRAKAKDINELSGRTHGSEVTQFVNSAIADKMGFGPDDLLVDIGCGDGTLLKLSVEQGASCIGILPTEEETIRVRERFSGSNAKVRIEKGLASDTGLPSSIATKIVCNGVFLLLDERDIDLALEEIVRIAKQDALVYIGELPFCDESKGKDYGDSIILWLLWVLRNQGLWQFALRLKQTFKALFSEEPMIVSPDKIYFCTPNEFIEKAKGFGLIEKDTYRHKSISSDKTAIESSSRQDYLFIVNRS